jgi:hypothetical protein
MATLQLGGDAVKASGDQSQVHDGFTRVHVHVGSLSARLAATPDGTSVFPQDELAKALRVVGSSANSALSDACEGAMEEAKFGGRRELVRVSESDDHPIDANGVDGLRHLTLCRRVWPSSH